LKLTLRKSIALASTMDLFISPDSAFIHVAGAFNIPQVGLYGPFPSRLRMLYYKNAIGLNAVTACTPCQLHGHFPCDKGDPSPCFSVIDPNLIIQAVDFLFTNRYNEEPLKYAMEFWRRVEATKTLVRFSQYMVGQGIDIGSGYFKHPLMKSLDFNPFTRSDILKDICMWHDDKEYDFVFSSFVLHDIENINSALINMLAMLKNEGHLLLYVPHKEHYPESNLDEQVVTSWFENIPNVEIMSLEIHGSRPIEEFDKVNRDIEEYAMSIVVKKI